MNSSIRTFLILLISLFIFTELVFLLQRDSSSGKNSWEARIRLTEADEVLEEFKKENNLRPFSERHSQAHRFGETLYETIGIDGVTICDNSYGFGCYHGFFGRALSEKGFSILIDLDKACIDKFGVGGQGCQHGIGHGLLEYVGYKNVNKALEECAKLEWKKPLLGCQGGVFMEYHFPITVKGEKIVTAIKNVEKDNPYDPCSSVPKKFRISCIFSLGEWWKRSNQMSYKEIGELCSNSLTPEEINICYKGTGYGIAVANVSDLNIKSDIEDCNKISGGNKNSNIYCRSGIFWALWNVEEHKKFAPETCQGLGEDIDICLKEGNIAESL